MLKRTVVVTAKMSAFIVTPAAGTDLIEIVRMYSKPVSELK